MFLRLGTRLINLDNVEDCLYVDHASGAFSFKFEFTSGRIVEYRSGEDEGNSILDTLRGFHIQKHLGNGFAMGDE
jgi:hypothetical protein